MKWLNLIFWCAWTGYFAHAFYRLTRDRAAWKKKVRAFDEAFEKLEKAKTDSESELYRDQCDAALDDMRRFKDSI